MKTATLICVFLHCVLGLVAPTQGGLRWMAFVVNTASRVREEPHSKAKRVDWDPSAIPLTLRDSPAAGPVVARNSEGRWLHVQFGWIRESEVIELAEAAKRFEVAIKKKPAAFLWASLARAKMELGDMPEALGAAEEALRCDADSAIAWHTRGVVRAHRGDSENAVADFTQAIRLRPRWPDAYIALGELHLKAKHYNLAIEQFRKVLEAGPDDVAEVHYRLGVAYREQLQFDAAMREFRTVQRLAPWRLDALNSSREAWTAKTLHDANVAIAKNPKDVGAYVSRASVYAGEGENDKALGDYDTAMRLAPNSTIVYESRAQLWIRTGEYGRALNDLAKVLKANPGNAHALRTWIWILATCPSARHRDGVRAVREGMKACEMSGWFDPYLIEALAAAYAETGDFKSAIKYEGIALDTRITQAGAEYARDLAADAKPRLDSYRTGKPWRDGVPAKESQDGA